MEQQKQFAIPAKFPALQAAGAALRELSIVSITDSASRQNGTFPWNWHRVGPIGLPAQ
jgi:hypothetical protein